MSGWSGWKYYSQWFHYNGADYSYWEESYRIGPYDWSNPNCPDPTYYWGGTSSFSSTPTTQTSEYYLSTSGSYWYGSDSTYYSSYSREELSDEYTTSELRSRLESDLSGQSWSDWWSGFITPSFYLSSDEQYVSAQKTRYRFRFPTLSGVQYNLDWTVRTEFDAGGSSVSYRSASVMGTGGEVIVGPFEESVPSQNGYAYLENSSVSYYAPWGPWVVEASPSLALSANDPGNQCIGVQISVSAIVSTTGGTKRHYDTCGNSETAPVPISPSVGWTVTGISATPSVGTGSTATFTPTSKGTGTVTFTASASTSDPPWSSFHSSSTSFTVTGIVSLTTRTSDGTPMTTVDDGDGNPSTRVVLVPYTSSSSSVIFASLEIDPYYDCDSLPGCLTFTGGVLAGCPQAFRKVNRNENGKTEFIGSCCGARESQR